MGTVAHQAAGRVRASPNVVVLARRPSASCTTHGCSALSARARAGAAIVRSRVLAPAGGAGGLPVGYSLGDFCGPFARCSWCLKEML